MEQNNQHIDKIALLSRLFAGEATVEEQILIDKWKAESSENQQEFDSYYELWNLTGKASDNTDIDVDSEWLKMEAKIENSYSKVITLRRVIQIAAVFIIVSGLAFLGFYQMQQTVVKAPIASVLKVTLPDGSSVELNAGSRIAYRNNFGESHRNISLQGEAFFNVEKDPGLAFIITANNAQIEVLGTSFNVKAYKRSKEVKVYVSEGTVTLYNKNEKTVKTLLSAGESGVYNHELQFVKKETVVSINDIAWKTMIIELEETPLRIVEEILESTYHKEIVLSDEIKNCPVTASFKNNNLEFVLQIIQETLDLEITSDNKKIYITGPKCEN